MKKSHIFLCISVKTGSYSCLHFSNYWKKIHVFLCISAKMYRATLFEILNTFHIFLCISVKVHRSIVYTFRNIKFSFLLWLLYHPILKRYSKLFKYLKIFELNKLYAFQKNIKSERSKNRISMDFSECTEFVKIWKPSTIAFSIRIKKWFKRLVY